MRPPPAPLLPAPPATAQAHHFELHNIQYSLSPRSHFTLDGLTACGGSRNGNKNVNTTHVVLLGGWGSPRTAETLTPQNLFNLEYDTT